MSGIFDGSRNIIYEPDERAWERMSEWILNIILLNVYNAHFSLQLWILKNQVFGAFQMKTLKSIHKRHI